MDGLLVGKMARKSLLRLSYATANTSTIVYSKLVLVKLKIGIAQPAPALSPPREQEIRKTACVAYGSCTSQARS